MKRGDVVVIGLVLALAVAAFPLAASARSAGTSVRISGPEGVTVLAMDGPQRVQVAGAHGRLTVELAHGRARVVQADCPDQVCVRSGWSGSGRPVVCAPNAVVIESGEGDGDIDAVSR